MKTKWLIVVSLVAIECLLCIGIGWITWASVSQTDFRFGFLQFDTFSAEADEEKRLTVERPVTLVVEHVSGNVVVQGEPGNEIVIKTHKQAWGPSQADADTTLAAVGMSVTQDAQTIRVKHLEEPFRVVVIGSVRLPTVNLTITVPSTTVVTIRNDHGNVSLSGTSGEADLQANHGTVYATDVTGNLKLFSDRGAVTVTQAMPGGMQLSSNRGSVTVSDVRSNGTVSLGSDYASILFKNGRAGSLTVEANRGSVTLSSLAVRDKVAVFSDYGDVKLEQVQAASFDLQSNRGSVTIDGVSNMLKAYSDYGNVDVKNGNKVTLDLRANRGSVIFAGSLGDGPHTLQSDYGSVRLSLPKDAALTVDLRTDRGRIRSDLAVAGQGDLALHWSGTINGGGAHLTAITNSGDISLNILNP